MTARAYLFVSKATVRWCIARYLATDHPENMRAWRDMYPFAPGGPNHRASDYSTALQQRRELSTYLSQYPDPFLPENWTFVDVSTWWTFDGRSSAAQSAAQLATMSPQSQAFMRSPIDPDQVVQWSHVMDPELATQWLKRAMKVTPAQIGALPPAEQFTAIAEMWASFGQYWKAMNIAPQGWAKYRAAWEYYARPANAQIVLKDGAGLSWPRPSTVPLWPYQSGQWYPENAPKYLGPWRWEAILANEQWGQARTGHTRLDANVTVRFGSIANYKERFNDNGSAQWGVPVPYGPVGGSGRTWACQDWVMFGGLDQPPLISDPGTCFAPTGEVHAFWIDNAGMMSGGMNPVWMGVTENTAGQNLVVPGGPFVNTSPVFTAAGNSQYAIEGSAPNQIIRDRVRGTILRMPSNLVTAGSATRRPRYLWGVTRCADSPPDVESLPASSFYTRFEVSGAKAYDWSRTQDAQADSIAVRSPSGQPRTSGEQTWTDGVLASIPPGGWGKDYVGWPVTGAAWADLNQSNTGSKVAGQWSPAVPYNVIGYSGFANAYEGESDFSLVLWQPPPKRYVDLLWPLLMYLDSKTPQEVAYEVKMDVMGKNGFSLRALGDVLDPATSSRVNLENAAAARFRQVMVTARERAQEESDRAEAERFRPAKLVLAIVQAVTVTIVSAAATPAVGAAVTAGFGLLNGAFNLLQQTNRSLIWNLTGTDIFGRPDGVVDTANPTMILGNYERYSLFNISSAQQGTVAQVKGQMYDSMRRVSRQPDGGVDGWAPFWPGFVEDAGPDPGNRRDPYPVGFPAPSFFFGGTFVSPDMLVTMMTVSPARPAVRLRNLESKPKLPPSNDVKPATLAAAAVAGIAVGALISEATRDV